jgi:hypothetical protein
MDADELSFANRFPPIGPLVDRLATARVLTSSGSQLEATNTAVGIGILYGLAEEVASIVDGVVALAFLLVQRGAGLGLTIEEIRQQRQGFDALRDDLLELAGELGWSVLRLPEIQVRSTWDALKRVNHQVHELRSALRNGQPFRYGRAAGHLLPAVVSVVRMARLAYLPRAVRLSDLPASPLGLRGSGVNQVPFIAVMKQAMTRLANAGVRGLHPTDYGRRLHAEIDQLISQGRAHFPAGWSVYSETSMANLAGRLRIPQEILDLTVEQYVDRCVQMGRISESLGRRIKSQLGRELLASRVARLKPDVVATDGAGNLMVVDHTHTQRVEHLAKTDLCAAILSEGQAVNSVSMSETYW